MMTSQSLQRAAFEKRAKHLMVLAFFLCSAATGLATSNVVTGLAYGSDHDLLKTAEDISSLGNTNGTLVVGFAGTTNLTLAHDITGYVWITNKTADFTVAATGAELSGADSPVFGVIGATNLTLTGGRFIGLEGDPLVPSSGAAGGLIDESTVSITGSEFAGYNYGRGLELYSSELTASDITIRGGENGIGLFASNSTVTISSGSVTGGLNTTAIYLIDSDITTHDGSFTGDLGGSGNVAGAGLFSLATTNGSDTTIALHGGMYRSLAFYGEDGTVQNFLAGTNLVVQDGIILNGGTVIVENLSGDALQEVYIAEGVVVLNRDFTLESGGVFNLGPGRLTAQAGLTANAGSDISLALSGVTNILADTALFQSNATLNVDASGGAFSPATNDITVLATANGIFVDSGGSTNSATTASFNGAVNLNVMTNWLTAYQGAFIDGTNNLRLQFVKQKWSEAWGAEGQLAKLADELEQLDDGTMDRIIGSLGKDASKAAVETTYFTTFNSFQTILLGMQSAVGQSVSRGAEFREAIKLRPSGVWGPQHLSKLRGWAKYYGNRYSHDAADLNPRYETQLDGGVIGADMSLGSLLLGLGGGYGKYTTEAGINAEENIKAYHGTLYGTFGFERAYLDAGAAYGFNQVETRTSSPFVLNGEFDAQILSAYLGGGIDLVDSTEGMVFTPEASVQYSLYEQEAYSETGEAVPREIDAFDADSLRTSLGLNVSVDSAVKLETFSFKYDLRVHWIREFNPEPGNMSFNLQGGSNGYQLTHPMLDEDTYRAGIGAVFYNTKRTQPRNVLFRVDFDELFGDGFNSHNLSAKVIYAF